MGVSSDRSAPAADRTGAKVAFVTMGCAKNEVDSAHMADRLAAAGYEVVEDVSDGDIVIVNTCAFIQAATEESIDAILEVTQLENVRSRGAKIVVAGCMPARYGGDVADEFPEVSAFVPCAEEDGIADVVDDLVCGDRDSGAAGADWWDVARIADGSTHAYVKISDGCDRFCAYCTIPFIRGRYHSFELEEIDREVARQVAGGAREIVLIAQDTGRWGQDFEEPSSLAALVATLARSYPDAWFRVMYIQPEGVTDELIEVIASHDNVCDYFDIPFQHCDPAILKSMNRRGDRDAFLGLIERIRARVPDAAIRTTLIAGYPGETDEQFEDLCDFIADAQLDYVGVFPYSREEGTRAYDLPDQVDEDEKMLRAQRLRDIADTVSGPVIARRIGSQLDVIVSGSEEDGQLYGRAMCQAPDVDGVTYVDSGEIGQMVRVSIEDSLLYEMEGEVIA